MEYLKFKQYYQNTYTLWLQYASNYKRIWENVVTPLTNLTPEIDTELNMSSRRCEIWIRKIGKLNVKCDDEYGSKIEIKCSVSQLSVLWRRFLTTATRQPLRVSELESGCFRPVIAVVRIIWGIPSSDWITLRIKDHSKSLVRTWARPGMTRVTAALVRRTTMTDTATSPKNQGGFIHFSSWLNDYDLWAGNSSNYGALFQGSPNSLFPCLHLKLG